MDFAKQLISWYEKNKRRLPWRDTTDAYKIWLSEVILQQTRVEQGLDYYHKFVKTFPSVYHLAKAPLNKVMKLWQGLGYYSRARNLHATAKQIVNQYKGKFPQDILTLKELKGVGDYTAAAIASFAFNMPHAVVDGNVMRVISRIFGISEPIDKPATKKAINKIADELLPPKNPAIFNQAIMEFGALQCRPANPDCNVCCMKKICFAWENKIVDRLPYKTMKTAVRNRYLNYLVISCNEHIYINKRDGNDIWRNLFDFPCIETNKQTEPDELMNYKEWKKLFGKKKIYITSVSGVYKHNLSHQTLYARFYAVTIKSPLLNQGKSVIMIRRYDLKKYAVPRLIDKYIQSL